MDGGDREERVGPTELAVVASNLVPIAGVFALGWSTTAFLVVYLLDLCAVVVWTWVKIPFARKRPNNGLEDRSALLGPLQAKRGGWTLPGPLPPAYLRNLPTLVAAVPLGAVAVGAGVTVFALTRPEITDAVGRAALLGGAAVFCSRGIETALEYGRRGGYREHSPRSLLLTPYKHLLGLGALLLVLAPLESTGAAPDGVVDPKWLLIVVAGGKLWADLRTVRLRRTAGRRGLFAKLYGSPRTEIEPIPVETPDGEPLLRTAPPRRVVLADAAVHGLNYGFVRRGIVLVPFLALAWLASDGRIAAVGVAVGAALAGVRATTRYLRYGTLEYRCYDDAVVVHDRLLDEPQARLGIDAITDAVFETGKVDRLFGTETLALDAVETEDDEGFGLFAPAPEDVSDDANEDRPLRLVHVPDATAAAAALGVAWRLSERNATEAGAE